MVSKRKGDIRMEFRELHYFLAVVEEGTISGAAEALHVAQPSLSRQMRELEEKIGKTLFIFSSLLFSISTYNFTSNICLKSLYL